MTNLEITDTAQDYMRKRSPNYMVYQAASGGG
jgi:hypothetical protein